MMKKFIPALQIPAAISICASLAVPAHAQTTAPTPPPPTPPLTTTSWGTTLTTAPSVVHDIYTGRPYGYCDFKLCNRKQ